MKLTSLLLLINIIQLNAAISGFSQNERFSIKSDKIFIKELLDKIEAESNYKFLYRSDYLNNSSISVNAKNATLEELLTEALGSTDITFKVLANDLVVIAPKEFTGSVQQKVTGSVTDATTKETIAGASVQIEGTTNGVITDNNGKFSIDAAPNDVIIISYVGYISERITVTTQTAYNTSLVPDIKNLEEVVVVGYGTQRRSNLTGNIASVKASDLINLPHHSVAEALQGKVAGVIVATEGGIPGKESQININGISSINGTPPLWIVDGVPSTPGNGFNINDIESVEILKDGSSAAIYGAAAAGSVILVTTKRGKENDKVVVDFSSSWGNNSPIGLPKLLNRDDFIKYKKIALVNYDPTNDKAYDVNWKNPAYVASLPNTDWEKAIFKGSGLNWKKAIFNKTGFEQQYNMSVSGGTKNARFYVSGNYLDQKGTFILNYFKRYSLRANSDFNIRKRIKIGESIYVDRTDLKAPHDEAGLLTSIFRASPLAPIYDETNLAGNGWGRSAGGGGNPVGYENVIHKETFNNNFNGNIYGQVEFIPGLIFKTILSASISDEHFEERDLAYDFGGIKNGNAVLIRKLSRGLNLQNTMTLTYEKTFEKHTFRLMAGYEASKGDKYKTGITGVGFKVTDPSSFSLITNSSGLIVNGGDNNYEIGSRTISQIGRINYGYADKYLLTFNIRRDGKSEFGANNRFGVFPGISGAWRIGQESFIKDNLQFINELKIRGGYSTLGNTAGITAFGYENSYNPNIGNSYTFTNSAADYVQGINVVRFPNPDIHWEIIKQTDIGFDFSLFQNKIQGSFSYYNKKTSDMIYGIPVAYMDAVGAPNAAGQTVNTNIGSMQNRGINISVSYQNKIGDFSYGADFVFGSYRNKLLSLDLPKSIIEKGGYGLDGTPSNICRTQVGQPLGQFYGYVVEGIWQSQSEIDQANARSSSSDHQYQKNTGNPPKPGDFKYSDLNGDSVVNDKDQTVLGNPWPKATYGLRLYAGFKGIDASVFFDAVTGQDIYDATIPVYQGFFSDFNSTDQISGAWDAQTNPNSSKPKLVDGDPSGNYKTISNYFVKNGSYLKLRNFQIGYTLPDRISQRLGLTKLRFYLTGQNLLTISPYKREPELGGDVLARNIDNIGRYPLNRYLGGGLDISF